MNPQFNFALENLDITLESKLIELDKYDEDVRLYTEKLLRAVYEKLKEQIIFGSTKFKFVLFEASEEYNSLGDVYFKNFIYDDAKYDDVKIYTRLKSTPLNALIKNDYVSGFSVNYERSRFYPAFDNIKYLHTFVYFGYDEQKIQDFFIVDELLIGTILDTKGDKYIKIFHNYHFHHHSIFKGTIIGLHRVDNEILYLKIQMENRCLYAKVITNVYEAYSFLFVTKPNCFDDKVAAFNLDVAKKSMVKILQHAQ